MSQNTTHQFIGEMVNGLVFDGFYILNSAQIRKSRAGKPYLSGTLMDIYNAALSKTEEGAFSDYVRALDKRVYHATA